MSFHDHPPIEHYQEGGIPYIGASTMVVVFREVAPPDAARVLVPA
jgi:hypothetical protein